MEIDRSTPERFLNRELSWLDFNGRVLELAATEALPLLERVKFLSIFANNLDEFFMVRVAGLKRQVAAGVTSLSPDGLTPREQLQAISVKSRGLSALHAELFCRDVMPALAENDIPILRWAELDDVQRKEMHRLFSDAIFPVVTPLAVDPAHPFPYISNLSLNLAVLVRDPETAHIHFARVKVPPIIPRFISLSEDDVFVPLEDVMAANLDQLFPGMEIVEHHPFRVTRNADLEVNDDGAEDLLQALEEGLRRIRFSPAVRLEVGPDMPVHVRSLLVRELEVGDGDVHELTGLLGLTDLAQLHALDRPDLRDPPFIPATHEALVTEEDEPSIFKVLRQQDVLVHHPYDSFRTSVQRLLEQAAADPNVLAIKQTVYRTSGDSPIVDALIDAAGAGKQVVAVVELKARFDERANINWARALEQAGCHVTYGIVGYKTHAKLCLVVRQEGKELRRYAHVGTGNYNPKTARLYEDLGLLTSEEQLTSDVSHLFNLLTGYAREGPYRTLLVAPHNMLDRMVGMIERECRHASNGGAARIAMKLNSLVDERIVDALYAASCSGVDVDLIVRGICSLRPGVPGLSENIRVRSILGRFLEHSRIYRFYNGGDEEIYIGSADMMHRNLYRRVETIARVESEDAAQELRQILDMGLRDNVCAWDLTALGTWERVGRGPDEEPFSLQGELSREAAERA